MNGRRTPVAIVGAGPAGLTLGLLLRRAGIESTILEARDRAYIERRMHGPARAGDRGAARRPRRRCAPAVRGPPPRHLRTAGTPGCTPSRRWSRTSSPIVSTRASRSSSRRGTCAFAASTPTARPSTTATRGRADAVLRHRRRLRRLPRCVPRSARRMSGCCCRRGRSRAGRLGVRGSSSPAEPGRRSVGHGSGASAGPAGVSSPSPSPPPRAGETIDPLATDETRDPSPSRPRDPRRRGR
jgi:hypothetical protein